MLIYRKQTDPRCRMLISAKVLLEVASWGPVEVTEQVWKAGSGAAYRVGNGVGQRFTSLTGVDDVEFVDNLRVLPQGLVSLIQS